MKTFASTVLILLCSVAAFAQPPAAPNGPNRLVRVAGTLTAVSSDTLKVRDASGKEVSLAVGPDISVVAAHPVSKASIKPGDFVASANLNQSDGVGRSIEIRLFEPGSHAGEGNRPMTQPGAASGQMMTNATVTKATQTKAGLELDVQYPGGVRHLVVPPDVSIVGFYPVDPSNLKRGTAVTVFATRGTDDTLQANRVQLTKAPSTAH